MAKKLIIGCVAVIVLLIAAALIAPLLIPTDTYKNQLIAAVKQATGRELKIDGPVRFSLLPQIEIEANAVSFANAPGASDPEMMRLKQLQVQLRLLPLLHGAVEVGRFALTEPVIALEIAKDGRPNWVFAPPAATPAQPTPAAPAAGSPSGGATGALAGLRLDDVRFSGGRVSYRDDRTGKAQIIEQIDMKLSLPALDSPFAGEGSLLWNGEKIGLKLTVAKPGALLAGGASGIEMHVDARPVAFGFTGQSQGLPPTKVDGAIELAVPSLRELAKWAGSPLPPGGGLGRLAIKGKLDVQGPRISFADATVALDAITALGSIAVDSSGARPALKGDLRVDKLDLNPYLPPETAPAGSKPAAADAGTGGAGDAAGSGWSDAPIDVSGLNAADADFALRAGSILYRKIEIGPSALDLHLKNGKLAAILSELNLYQGKGKGNVTVDGSGSVPAIALNFDLSGVQVEPLLKAAAGSDRLSGSGKVSFDVASTGRSQRALVAALNGKGALDLANGQIKGVNLIGMVQNAASALTGAKADDKTDFGSLTGTFTITKGVLDNKDLQLKSVLAPVSGAGTSNLLARTVDYRAVVSLAGALAIPVVISGPWDDIHYRPDIPEIGDVLKGAAQQPGKVIDQLKSLGGSGSGGAGASGTPNPIDKLKGLFGK